MRRLSLAAIPALLAFVCEAGAEQPSPRLFKEVHELCREFVDIKGFRDPVDRPFLIKRCMRGVFCHKRAFAEAEIFLLTPKERKARIDACVAEGAA